MKKNNMETILSFGNDIFDAISDAVKDESPMQLIIFFGIGFDTALIVFSLFKLDIRFLKVIK